MASQEDLVPDCLETDIRLVIVIIFHAKLFVLSLLESSPRCGQYKVKL